MPPQLDTSVAGTAYTYDDSGNLAFGGQFHYYYDCESRLIDINDANDAPVASYAYDYLGRRISRTIYGAPDVTIKYTCDGGNPRTVQLHTRRRVCVKLSWPSGGSLKRTGCVTISILAHSRLAVPRF